MNFGNPNVLILWLVNVRMGHAMHDGKCRRFATVGESDYVLKMKWRILNKILHSSITFIDSKTTTEIKHHVDHIRISKLKFPRSEYINHTTIAIAKVKMFSLFHRFSLIVNIIIFYNNKVGMCYIL